LVPALLTTIEVAVLARGGHRGAHRVRIGHVGRVHERAPVALGRDRLELVAGAGHERDRRAQLHQRERARAADPAARAGDQRVLPVEPQ
jgi:hypothetical protein